MRSKTSWRAVTTVTLLAGYGIGLASASAARADGLAQTPYAKFRGDMQNTGRGGGAGATGDKLWEVETGFENYGSAAIGADGTVYIVSNDHNLYALDGKTGAKKWTAGLAIPQASSPSIGSDGVVYVAAGNKLYALDPTDGTKKWDFETTRSIYSSPAIGADGTIYIGCSDQKIYAIH